MKNNRIFLDTNILIYLLQGDLDIRELLEDKIWYISFISEMELRLKSNTSEEEMKAIQAILKECFIIDMNHSIKETAIISAQRYKLKLADSIIYASAYHLEMVFLTADKIFNRISSDDIRILLYEL